MTPIAELSFLSSAQKAAFKKRGVNNIRDLLFYFPRKYIDRNKKLEISKIQPDEIVTFIGLIQAAKVNYGRKRRLSITCVYERNLIEITFFQRISYYQKILKPGVEAAFSGKIDLFRGRLSMTHPEFEIVTEDDFIHTGKIIPVYKITELMQKNFLTSRVIRDTVHKVLKKYSVFIEEYLPNDIIKKYEFQSLSSSIETMHFPGSWENLSAAKKRLAFDELIVFSCIMHEEKENRKKIKKKYNINSRESAKYEKNILENLSFKLTKDQQKACDILYSLSEKPYPFAALLQGDVGCGKTLVALLSAIHYCEAGIQTALMAPTEILARQHYKNFLSYLSSVPFFPIDILLGAEKAKERASKLERLKRGETKLIIGTHSLFQNDVAFYNLGYVIIDEQHRFGVEQREALRAKGENPDLLAMTATPIPRSLTLTLYGDLETVLIKEKPAGRKPIETKLFDEFELSRLYKGVKKYVDEGRQAYIVYPVIDESENIAWASLMADYEKLEKNEFKGYRLGILHGRLSGEEKERAMQKFKEGLIQILIATTVVEVGVDVANATVMLIRNAERFGLSQLHQLRGRVGRADLKSFCILVKSNKITIEAEKRLEAMIESEDGFYLAQKDLEIRGPGELLGIKQAGFSEFKVADLRYHSDLAEKANQTILEVPSLREKIKSIKNWQKDLKKGFLIMQN
ncbi:MAG: ATP-dependent DNA helicase RecG [Spirochaetia bacterium]|nr:ATP-dependent DNA helicase RecG [Spirochaetia bacterium]